MANINPYIEQIASARYGKDVRQAIVDALTAMNDEITGSGVQSFNNRIGEVIPAKDDYNISQIASTGGVEGQVPVVNAHGGFTMRSMTGEIQTLEQLSNVIITNPSTGQALVYDETNDEWVNGTVSGGTLEQLSDVYINNPTNDQILKYNATTNKWENSTSGNSGGRELIGAVEGTSSTKYKDVLEQLYLNAEDKIDFNNYTYILAHTNGWGQSTGYYEWDYFTAEKVDNRSTYISFINHELNSDNTVNVFKRIYFKKNYMEYTELNNLNGAIHYKTNVYSGKCYFKLWRF